MMASRGINTGFELYNATEEEKNMSNNEWLVMQDNKKEGELHLKDGYDCELCKNKGFIFHYHKENDSTSQSQCKCIKTRQIIINAKHSGMGELLDYRLNQYETTEEWQRSLRDVAKNYILENSDKWFVILGQSGIGKSMLCAAICNQRLTSEHKQVKYMIWNDFIDHLKRMKYDIDRDDYFNEYANAEILYIDDLFKGKYTETDVNYCFTLINHRYNKKLTTVISSELLMDQLVDIDEAIAGRIKERSRGYCTQIAKDYNKNYRFRD